MVVIVVAAVAVVARSLGSGITPVGFLGCGFLDCLRHFQRQPDHEGRTFVIHTQYLN